MSADRPGPRAFAGLPQRREGDTRGGLLSRFPGKERTPTYTQVMFTPEPMQSQQLRSLFSSAGIKIPDQYVRKPYDDDPDTIQVSIPVSELFQLIRGIKKTGDENRLETVAKGVREIMGNTVTQADLQASYQNYLSQKAEGKLKAREEWEKGAERHIHNIFSALELERLGKEIGVNLAITPEEKTRCGMDKQELLKAAAQLLDIIFVYSTYTPSDLQEAAFDVMLPMVTEITNPSGPHAFTVDQVRQQIKEMQEQLRQANPEEFGELYGDGVAPDTNFADAPTAPHSAIRRYPDATTQPVQAVGGEISDETDGIDGQPTIQFERRNRD